MRSIAERYLLRNQAAPHAHRATLRLLTPPRFDMKICENLHSSQSFNGSIKVPLPRAQSLIPDRFIRHSGILRMGKIRRAALTLRSQQLAGQRALLRQRPLYNMARDHPSLLHTKQRASSRSLAITLRWLWPQFDRFVSCCVFASLVE